MAKQKSTAIASWDQRLADLAKQSMKTMAGIGGGGNFLSIRGGILTYQGATVPGNKMRAIIIDAVLENQYYSTPFDPENPSPPDCYAFGREKNEMAPNPEHVENIQHPTCTGCPQAQFGSADRGKGKACHACQRIALVSENDLDNILTAEEAYMKLPFFSTLEYAAYTRQLADTFHKPPLAFITEISVVPDPKSQFRVKFTLGEEIKADAGTYDGLWKKYEQVSKTIMFPYPKREEAPAKNKRNGRQQAAPPARAAARRSKF